jgi:hypothetical protein
MPPRTPVPSGSPSCAPELRPGLVPNRTRGVVASPGGSYPGRTDLTESALAATRPRPVRAASALAATVLRRSKSND